MSRNVVRKLCASLALLAIAAGCSGTAQTTRTLHDPAYADATFSNFLVIALGENYDARAQFERQLVSALRSNGASATAYYTIAGNKPQLVREDVDKAIAEGGFDAVVVTRVKGQQSTVDVVSGAPDTKTTRKSGTAFDLFRYDYEEMNDPDTVEVSTSVVVVCELYDAKDQKKIWAIESSASSTDGTGVLIDQEVETVIKHLKKDGLIGG